jgi:hypothetical protein
VSGEFFVPQRTQRTQSQAEEFGAIRGRSLSSPWRDTLSELFSI